MAAAMAMSTSMAEVIRAAVTVKSYNNSNSNSTSNNYSSSDSNSIINGQGNSIIRRK